MYTNRIAKTETQSSQNFLKAEAKKRLGAGTLNEMCRLAARKLSAESRGGCQTGPYYTDCWIRTACTRWSRVHCADSGQTKEMQRIQNLIKPCQVKNRTQTSIINQETAETRPLDILQANLGKHVAGDMSGRGLCMLLIAP